MDAKLILGAGSTRRDGWMTLDANPARGADFLATIPPLPDTVKAVKWEEIEWIHGIASVYPWEAEQILPEIRDVLIPGGRLTLETPNYEKCASIRALYGDPSLRDPFHMNRWSWTPESLSALLMQSGFSRIDVCAARYHDPKRDFRLEAYR